MMLTENYSFTVVESGINQTITLTQLKTGEVKVFDLVGKSVDGLTQHMESLSEDCCSGFFPKKREK